MEHFAAGIYRGTTFDLRTRWYFSLDGERFIVWPDQPDDGPQLKRAHDFRELTLISEVTIHEAAAH